MDSHSADWRGMAGNGTPNGSGKTVNGTHTGSRTTGTEAGHMGQAQMTTDMVEVEPVHLNVLLSMSSFVSIISTICGCQ
jgi:hypothetical protein